VTTAELLPELATVPAGPFVMGSDDGAADERPTHTVDVDAFAIGVHPVTNAEYARFVRETRYREPRVGDLPLVVRAGGADREVQFRAAAGLYTWRSMEPPQDRLSHPVTLVRWDDANAYCRWLSRVLGRVVRLPTEAEWEKAARGGLERQPFPWGRGLDPERANFLSDPAHKNNHGTTPCRTYSANGYGLFDMAGNVWEWVADWYDAEYYTRSPQSNPTGPADGHLRIVRGGGWLAADASMLTCSHRHRVPPDTYSYSIGFRVVCSPE
jgi:formylglycine-generating enzyme required for sulfatase activity